MIGWTSVVDGVNVVDGCSAVDGSTVVDGSSVVISSVTNISVVVCWSDGDRKSVDTVEVSGSTSSEKGKTWCQ